MVFHGFWLVSMVFQGSFMVFHGFWLVSMIFQVGFMVFHSFLLVSKSIVAVLLRIETHSMHSMHLPFVVLILSSEILTGAMSHGLAACAC